MHFMPSTYTVWRQTSSVPFCVPLAGRVAGYSHVSTTATQHSQDFLRPNSVDFPQRTSCLRVYTTLTLTSVGAQRRAARLIHRSSRYEHITPMLLDLHWLWSPERIDFRLLAVLICRATVSVRLHPALRRFQPPLSIRSSSSSQPVIPSFLPNCFRRLYSTRLYI